MRMMLVVMVMIVAITIGWDSGVAGAAGGVVSLGRPSSLSAAAGVIRSAAHAGLRARPPAGRRCPADPGRPPPCHGRPV